MRFTGLVSFAIIAFAAGSASAADLALPRPAAVAPWYSWTGFYVGGNVGYSVARDPSTSEGPHLPQHRRGVFPDHAGRNNWRRSSRRQLAGFQLGSGLGDGFPRHGTEGFSLRLRLRYNHFWWHFPGAAHVGAHYQREPLVARHNAWARRRRGGPHLVLCNRRRRLWAYRHKHYGNRHFGGARYGDRQHRNDQDRLGGRRRDRGSAGWELDGKDRVSLRRSRFADDYVCALHTPEHRHLYHQVHRQHHPRRGELPVRRCAGRGRFGHTAQSAAATSTGPRLDGRLCRREPGL